VANSFLDLVTYIMRTDDLALRRHMLHRYLGLWSRHLPADALDAVSQLALVVGALHQAYTYSQLIPTVMPDDLGQLRNGDATWLRRALDGLNHGIKGTHQGWLDCCTTERRSLRWTDVLSLSSVNFIRGC
jgi:hypothetical protein